MAEVSVKKAARTFAVLACPGRLDLLLALASRQVCDVATLARLCDRSQPYVSQQLRVLRDHGLVVGAAVPPTCVLPPRWAGCGSGDEGGGPGLGPKSRHGRRGEPVLIEELTLTSEAPAVGRR